jgi:hypothetical protein
VRIGFGETLDEIRLGHGGRPNAASSRPRRRDWFDCVHRANPLE